ncbi:hypothetical protein ATJ88_0444 [Isoptericola jiangsuensis]|uniref:Uncharacterized protein n=1 Tax=Isoptericola jiangsuensis TaxID=548579 RepID=A0A2A9ETD6_9MICO|nr:hypothetical protein [Isoptericola jiangsuensis]PFG41801.1 hypothetical protein ATJ88_0444 [Isoptericola jiangsuensis]
MPHVPTTGGGAADDASGTPGVDAAEEERWSAVPPQAALGADVERLRAQLEEAEDRPAARDPRPARIGPRPGAEVRRPPDPG